MKITILTGRSDAVSATALEQFERQFSYPLGEAQHFHVLHGNDYPRFFRAIGSARCLIAEEAGQIVGSLAVVLRRIGYPDGNERDVGYLGDLKIAPHARGGRVLLRLAAAAEAWLRQSTDACFGVVMDGTAVTPDRYTGRAGIAGFETLAKVMVMRVETSLAPIADDSVAETSADALLTSFKALSAGRYWTPSTNPGERSLVAPTWLVSRAGTATGCLEDTRRAKRLISGDGSEMLSAHLSCFAYRDIEAGASLIRSTMCRASQLGFPALFLAVPMSDAQPMRAALDEHAVTLASATIFGHGIAPNFNWNLNTAEI